MRIRTVIVGISAAAVCLVVLYFQYYVIEPGRFVPGWSDGSPFASFPRWTSAIALIICAITLFAFGWVAARWNWTDTWQAGLQSGAGMGVLAGCILYDFIGAFWFSIKGQAEILQNAYTPVAEAEGIRILVEALLRTGLYLYVSFVVVLALCALLGGLGGLASAWIDKKDIWGTDPRNPEGWLFRMPAYLLAIFGFLNLIVVVAAINPLWDSMLKTITELDATSDVAWTLDSPFSLFPIYVYVAGLVFAFFPTGITWGWIIRSWFERGKPGFWSGLWIFLTTLGVAWVLLRTFVFGNNAFPLGNALMSIPFIAFVLGITLGLLTEERSEGFGYQPADWVGFGVTYGVLGGTQIFMGVVAYSLAVVLIGIVNIPHLIKAEPVDTTPVEQVAGLYRLHYSSSVGMMILSLVMGLVIAALVSFLRTVVGARDVAPPRSQRML